MPRTGRLMGAAEIGARLGVGETRAKYYIALPTWPATYDELAMGRVWWAADVEAWIAKHRPDLNADGDE
jgi:prophage regulatory protein